MIPKVPKKSNQALGSIKITILYSPFSGARKRAKKSAAPGSHKNHFQTGNFITRAGCAPHSNNKISNPFERLFVNGSKGAVQRQQHNLSGNNFSFETVRQCGNRVAQGVGMGGLERGRVALARCAIARHCENSMAQPVVLAGIERGGAARPLTRFF